MPLITTIATALWLPLSGEELYDDKQDQAGDINRNTCTAVQQSMGRHQLTTA